MTSADRIALLCNIIFPMSLLRVVLLFPFSLVYGLIMALRNKLYDWEVFKSYQPEIPTLVVGNLSTGGTGKTPHLMFFLAHLSKQYKTAVLSRGYGRKTRGYLELNRDSTATEVGDEPKQIKMNFPDTPVAVCEDRVTGIQKLLQTYPNLELILLDDAMQHRKISAGFVVMLSLFDQPFYKDWVLPSGNLREFAHIGKNRADVCIYTKAPDSIREETKKNFQLSFSQSKPIYFSRFEYGSWVPFSEANAPKEIRNILLVTGIAYPTPLLHHLTSRFRRIEHIKFKDHYEFSEKDIERIHQKFTNFDRQNSVILCSEKDAAKLRDFELITKNKKIPWLYIPVIIRIEGEEELLNQIHHYVRTHSRGSELHKE